MPSLHGQHPQEGPAGRPRVGSRDLLFPGPQAPLSHFGVTLLRHAATTGLRYALYQLGLPPPERPPVRIVGLRLLFDGKALASGVADPAGGGGGAQVAAAVIDPGGAGRLPAAAARLAAAARFHRARQVLGRGPGRRRRRRRSDSLAETPPAALWSAFRAHLSRRAGTLNEAFLAELLAAIARRRRRARGIVVEPAMSREAARLLAERAARLDRLGPPDLLRPSWDEDPAGRERALAIAASRPAPAADRRRGLFRETWRGVLDELRPIYLALAAGAARRGLLERPEDAFFLPFDLGADLALAERPSWLPPAVTANRREHERWGWEPDPTARDGEASPELWPAAPLWPLE